MQQLFEKMLWIIDSHLQVHLVRLQLCIGWGLSGWGLSPGRWSLFSKHSSHTASCRSRSTWSRPLARDAERKESHNKHSHIHAREASLAPPLPEHVAALSENLQQPHAGTNEQTIEQTIQIFLWQTFSRCLQTQSLFLDFSEELSPLFVSIQLIIETRSTSFQTIIRSFAATDPAITDDH